MTEQDIVEETTPAVTEQPGLTFRIPKAAWDTLPAAQQVRLTHYWDGEDREDGLVEVQIPPEVVAEADALERDWLQPFQVIDGPTEDDIPEMPMFRFFRIAEDSLTVLTPDEHHRLNRYRRERSGQRNYVDFAVPEEVYRQGSNNEREWLGMWQVDTLEVETATEEAQPETETTVEIPAGEMPTVAQLLAVMKEKDAIIVALAAEKGHAELIATEAKEAAELATQRVKEIVEGFHREAVALQRTKQWCDEGVNEVLDRMNLPQLPRKTEYLYRVPVIMTAHLSIEDLSAEAALVAIRRALGNGTAVGLGHAINANGWNVPGINSVQLCCGGRVHRNEIRFDLDNISPLESHDSIWRR